MDAAKSPIIGIDLGTTNSVVAAVVDGTVQVIREDGEAVLPSVVALTNENKLVIGHAAKNQLAVFPERTVASVKRRMGEAIKLRMADQEFSPPEVSAMILRRLRDRASHALGTEVNRAVITVPAFFDEHQRQATREAGQLAGLTVERIINEPTAASMVYHADDHSRRHMIVYDLGGGTFDVSIVRMEEGVVEVLSSKGDTQLGGDDFDRLLTKHVADAFTTKHGLDLQEDATTRWRLRQACERAKCELSSSATTRVTEEFIATVDGQPVNLDVEVTRREYEQLISPLVERTIECVDAAIRESGLAIGQLDELILVGGSTRTPLVQQRLSDEFERAPRWSVNPDLAVALGAATQAAALDGMPMGPVLIDVATHTLGIKALTQSGYTSQLRFAPVIRRNTPLPARFEDEFYTVSQDQESADIHVYQGESSYLSQNRSIGRFILEGLNEADDADGTIIVRFELNLDGILDVTAVERRTGVSKSLTIDNALAQMNESGRRESVDRLGALFHNSDDIRDTTKGGVDVPTAADVTAGSEPRAVELDADIRIDAPSQPVSKRQQLIAEARSIRDSLAEEDQSDIDRLIHVIERAEQQGNRELLPELESELEDLLFYLND
jgi:molecular chaperone DnaK